MIECGRKLLRNMEFPGSIKSWIKTPMVMASAKARAYGVSDIPSTFLIDRDGNLVSQFHLPQIAEVLNAMLNEDR